MHTHNWVTETIHHDATGHYESHVTGQEEVLVGYIPKVSGMRCDSCGQTFIGMGCSTAASQHLSDTGHFSASGYTIGERKPIYEPRDIVQNVWVEDTAAWDETVTTCSTCGAKK